MARRLNKVISEETSLALADTDEEDQSAEDEEEAEGQIVKYQPEPLEGDLISMAVCSIVCDLRNAERLEDFRDKSRHFCRCFWTLAVVFFVLWMQIYITVMVKALVTPFQVESVRSRYDHFQQVMYLNHTLSHEAVEGRHIHSHVRGVDGTFKIENFDTIDKEDRLEICQIPLTQPLFMFVILLMWSITCVFYLRHNMQLTHRILVATETIEDMAEALGDDDDDHVGKPKTVRGLTCPVKVLVLATIQVPQFLMIVYLMWLGCRWLLATIGFGELVLNAIALEFILGLHELVYKAIVPITMKMEISATNIALAARESRKQKLGCMNMFSSFVLLVVCIMWCTLYQFSLQTVLPDYKWDVKQACELHEPKSFSFFV